MDYERWIEWGLEAILVTTPFVISKILFEYATYLATAIKELQNAPRVEVGPALKTLLDNSLDAVLPYVAIHGQVVKELRSDAKDVKSYLSGFLDAFTKIRNSSLFSHGSETVREIVHGPVHFGLKGSSGMVVEVSMPLATQLKQGTDLSVFTDKVMDFVDKISPPDGLTVVGRVVLRTKDKLMIMPSLDEYSFQYLLTTSLDECIKRLNYKHAAVKCSANVVLGIGLVYSFWKLWKLWKKWKLEGLNMDNMEQLRIQIRARRETATHHENPENNDGILACCVVCLTIPRQVLFIPCGHVVCCLECEPHLRETCPICMTKYRNMHLAFLS